MRKTVFTLLIALIGVAQINAQATFNLAIGTGTGTTWTWNDSVLTVYNDANITIIGHVSNGRRIEAVPAEKKFY